MHVSFSSSPTTASTLTEFCSSKSTAWATDDVTNRSNEHIITPFPVPASAEILPAGNSADETQLVAQ